MLLNVMSLDGLHDFDAEASRFVCVVSISAPRAIGQEAVQSELVPIYGVISEARRVFFLPINSARFCE